jgi:hypothetical protein
MRERSKYTSRETTPENFWARVDKSGDCWIWRGRVDANGYGRVGYRSRPNIGAHRVAWALARNGGVLTVEWVLHRCDNPPCVNPDHLFLGSCADNNRDRHRKGRTRNTDAGADHPQAKLTSSQVREMRRLYGRYGQGGLTQAQLSSMFGVSRGNVSKVVNGRSY